METWREQERRPLGVGDHVTPRTSSMTGSAALGKVVLTWSLNMKMTMFDLHAPLHGSAAQGEEIFRAHFGRLSCFIQGLRAQFLVGDPRNLLVVAWYSGAKSGLQLMDVVTGTVVETVCADLCGRRRAMGIVTHVALAVAKGCIAVVVATSAPSLRRMVFRETCGRWHCELDCDAGRRHSLHQCSLSFASFRVHEPSRLLQMDAGMHSRTCIVLSGEERVRYVTKDGVDCGDEGRVGPMLVQTTGHDVVLAVMDSELVKLVPDGENGVAATTVHTFDQEWGCATYVPGYGLLVLFNKYHEGDNHLFLHTLVRTTMSPARTTWMQACVRRRAQ
jgi:hypothetical protein